MHDTKTGSSPGCNAAICELGNGLRRLYSSEIARCGLCNSLPPHGHIECARLCSTALCFALFRSASLCFALLRSASLCFALLRSASLCFALLRSASLCFALLRSALPCFALLRPASLCFALHRSASLYFALLRSASLTCACVALPRSAVFCFALLRSALSNCGLLLPTALNGAQLLAVQLIMLIQFTRSTDVDRTLKLPPHWWRAFIYDRC